MDKRIIDLSEEPASLRVHLDQLVIKREDNEYTLPLEELAVLIVSHPAVHYTHAVLSRICSFGGIFILCNDKRLPSGMLLPLEGNFVQAERFAAQTEVSLPTKKQIWKQIVSVKVQAQGRLLKLLHKSDFGLLAMSQRVQSGDKGNIEAQASRRYWQALFGHKFRRIPGNRDSINSLLNYGYAVLRGVTARAICAAGLHPTLGLHHHNRYNPFCLADDLMEPFRPLIDKAVFSIISKAEGDFSLNKENKSILINQLISNRLKIKKEERTIFDILSIISSSLAFVYLGKRRKLELPQVSYEQTT